MRGEAASSGITLWAWQPEGSHGFSTTKSRAVFLAWLGKVHGNVQIQSNVAPTAPDVSLVMVGGNLQCQHTYRRD